MVDVTAAPVVAAAGLAISDLWTSASVNATLTKDGRPYCILWADNLWSAAAIRQWAQTAMAKVMRDSIGNGVAPKDADMKAITSAFALANTIEQWQNKNPKLVGPV